MFDVKLPLEQETTSPYLEQALRSWNKVNKLQAGGKVLLDGENLDIASVIAVARYVSDRRIFRKVLTRKKKKKAPFPGHCQSQW
jgi:hypothetical protein